jgi:SulP family sulfate permease
MRSIIKNNLPFLDWLPNYDKSMFYGDLAAGITVGVMLIPQGMAYSMLAGLPPIYGLYAVTIPLLIYAFLGTSRQLAVGPVAMVALLIASGVSPLATGMEHYIALAIMLAFMVGLIQFSMGVFRLGFIVNFLAHPVISGFTSAAAIIIAVSQIKHIFGLDVARGKVHETLYAVFGQIGQVNIATLIISISSIVILIAVKKYAKRIPGPLIIVLLGISAVYFLGLHEKGVAIIKEVPAGLPEFAFPKFGLGYMKSLMPIALTISFIGFMESIAVAKAIQNKHKNYKLDPNQELRALGLSNLVGSMFQSFPVTGGFSRSAVNDQAGAKTGMASAISAILIILTLVFFTSYFYYLPKSVLAAIIIVAVYGLVDFKEFWHLWKVDKQDFSLFVMTFLATLVIGIEEGILAGVVLSVVMLVFNAFRPHIAQLGRLKGTSFYRNVKRFPEAETFANILIIRIDSQIFFANINHIKEFIDYYSEDKQVIILHCGSVEKIDSSAVHAISDWVNEYRQKNKRLVFTHLVGPVRDIIKKNGLIDIIGKENFSPDVNSVVQSIAKNKQHSTPDSLTLQSNI